MSMQRVAPLVSKDISNYLSNKKTWSFFFNVKDYGALGDGSTDDTAAIQSAFDAIPSGSRGAVYFPAGNYVVTAKISIADRGVTVVGTDKITSVISFYDCDGFEHTGEYQFFIRDIGLYTNGTSYTAIKLPSRLTLDTFSLYDVDMWGTVYGSTNWGVGIHLQDISNTWITRHTFIGSYVSSPFAAGIAVKIDSTIARGSTGHHMRDCTWNYAETCLDIDANHNISIEGVRLDNCGMVGVLKGVSYNGETSGYTPPLFTMKSCHIDLRPNGIGVELNSIAQVEVTGCDLYGFFENNKLFDISNCTQVMIDDNFLVAGVATGTTAINIVNSNAMQIQNNQFNGNWLNGIVIDALSNRIYEKNNKYFGAITNRIVDNSLQLFRNSSNRATLTTISRVLTSGANTKVQWSNAAPNWNNMWASGDPTKVTIPTGVYTVRITGQIRFNNEGGSTGLRQIVCLKNNAYSIPLPIMEVPATTSETTINFSSPNLPVTPGDYLELQVFQNSGVNVSISPTTSYFDVEVIDFFTK